ncbi:MAG: cobalamin-binding protein [Cyanosarcina radialis HA8281-LM2]|jgi:iron complex transport system substrate-binding protein|nr:cobalamin-binding protein [Cyanosarcina radialis HA8281-LM2]
MSNFGLRIVSLIPSATEIVAALGLTAVLVGRSHECDYPPEIQNRQVCTQARLNSERSSAEIHRDVTDLLISASSIYDLKIDILERLQPTHIITQDQCAVCAVSLADVERAIGQLINSHPQIISLQPQTLNDVWNDIDRVAKILGVESLSLIEKLQARVQHCQQKTQAIPASARPSVACIEWIEPLMLAGNWIPEMVKIAGGEPIGEFSGTASPLIKWEFLLKANPEVIIFMPCGFDLQRTRAEAMLLTKHPQWQKLAAVQNQRVYITDGNWYFNRPGPRLADSVEILAEIFHPEIYQYSYRGSGWDFLNS